MARTASVTRLKTLVANMRAERGKIVKRLAELDSFFAELGGAASGVTVAAAATPAPATAPKRRGRPPGGGRKKRGVFAITGEQSVLGFIKSNGKPTAAEVNEHWNGEGRGGKADNTLSKLVKAGQLKRIEAKAGERGGRYALA